MKALRSVRAALILLVLAALVLLPWAEALAGRPCQPKAPAVSAFEQGLGLAQKTLHTLDLSGARVVVIARAGQDLSRYGLRYSHLGFAYRDSAAGRWYVVHKLNHCGTDHAALYRQGLGEFFLDDPFRYEAGIVVLAPAVQEALLPVLKDTQRLAALHTRAYNMVAYPWSQKYQQSNQWAIETLAMALDRRVANRKSAQDWLMRHGYAPTVLRLGPLTRLGARATSANVAFDDHPSSKRFSDRIETVTVDSVFQWLASSGYGTGAPIEVR